MIKYTELKSINRQNLREVLPLTKPFTVLLEPSSCCNFRCVQCFQSLPESAGFAAHRMQMPLDRFRQALGQLQDWPGPRLKVLKLSLYGEPLIHPEFGVLLALARAAGIAERLETTTNASLLTPEVAEAMVQAQLDYLRVSIYATDQARHERITGSRMEVHGIREHLRVLQDVKRRHRSERPFVSCKMLDAYGPENERFLESYREVADEVFIDKPHNWIKIDGVDFLQAYYQGNLDAAQRDVRRQRTLRQACPMPFTTMAVRSNGAVSPCCVDFLGATNLGHLAEHSLREIWNSEPWLEFQKMQLENRRQENFACARCDVCASDHYTRDTIDGFPVTKLRALS